MNTLRASPDCAFHSEVSFIIQNYNSALSPRPPSACRIIHRRWIRYYPFPLLSVSGCVIMVALAGVLGDKGLIRTGLMPTIALTTTEPPKITASAPKSAKAHQTHRKARALRRIPACRAALGRPLHRLDVHRSSADHSDSAVESTVPRRPLVGRSIPARGLGVISSSISAPRLVSFGSRVDRSGPNRTTITGSDPGMRTDGFCAMGRLVGIVNSKTGNAYHGCPRGGAHADAVPLRPGPARAAGRGETADRTAEADPFARALSFFMNRPPGSCRNPVSAREMTPTRWGGACRRGRVCRCRNRPVGAADHALTISPGWSTWSALNIRRGPSRNSPAAFAGVLASPSSTSPRAALSLPACRTSGHHGDTPC